MRVTMKGTWPFNLESSGDWRTLPFLAEWIVGFVLTSVHDETAIHDVEHISDYDQVCVWNDYLF